MIFITNINSVRGCWIQWTSGLKKCFLPSLLSLTLVNSKTQGCLLSPTDGKVLQFCVSRSTQQRCWEATLYTCTLTHTCVHAHACTHKHTHTENSKPATQIHPDEDQCLSHMSTNSTHLNMHNTDGSIRLFISRWSGLRINGKVEYTHMNNTGLFSGCFPRPWLPPIADSQTFMPLIIMVPLQQLKCRPFVAQEKLRQVHIHKDLLLFFTLLCSRFDYFFYYKTKLGRTRNEGKVERDVILQS